MSVTDASESGRFRRSTNGPKLLRLRASERLQGVIEPSTSTAEAGFLRIPTREAVTLGELILVEFSFGAQADEIRVRGSADQLLDRGPDRAPVLLVRVVPEHAARLRYVHEVIAGGREATARASRRVPSQIQATWFWGLGSHATRISDISRGGAFIRSAAPPSVGSRIGLEINDTDVYSGLGSGVRPRAALRLEAIVAWTGRSQGHRGFGVKFRLVDRELAERVAALVRWQEQEAGLID